MLVTPVAAATLTVDPAGSSTYATIQDAIDAASSGDTVVIVAGTFTECIDTSGIDLTLIGAGAMNTTIDGASACTSAVSIVAGETVSLEDLSIANSGYRAIEVDSSTAALVGISVHGAGTTSTTTLPSGGGALYASDAGVSIESSSFSTNQGGSGGAIFATASTLDITDSEFWDNEAYTAGGAVHAEQGSALTLDGVTFDGDLASSSSAYGGAVHVSTSTSFSASDVSFSDHSAVYGGAIALRTTLTDTSLSDCTVEGSTASRGGGLFIASTLATTTIEDSTFSDNTASSSTGGGVFASPDVSLEVTGSTFSDNAASTGGAAIYTGSDSALVVSESTFSDNNNSANYGGGILASPASSTTDITVTDSTFSGNSSTFGGAIAVVNAGEIVFTGNISIENSGTTGIGAYFLTADSLEMSDNLFGCQGKTRGGGAGAGAAVLDIDPATVTHNIFMENAAPYGGGLYANSGATLDIVNNAFVGNTSGAAFLCHLCTADMVNNVVAHNSTTGVAPYSSGTVGFEYNDWYNNGTDVASGLTMTIGTDGNINDDPGFTDYSADGDCTNDDLSLSSSSALIDAGHPGILDDDGTTSDIGPDGGDNYTDGDGDGYDYDEDWDDDDATIYPGADESCDGVDNDCDGDTDEDDAVDVLTWYLDTDGDGYGDSSSTDTACDQPSGYVSDPNDCDDSRGNTYPGAAASEGSTTDCMTDADGDGYGDDSPAFGVTAGTDCDDTDSAVSPSATEECDGIDNDCDGDTDENDAIDALSWYLDTDGDGYGDSSSTDTACDQPSGYVSDPNDCDDSNANTHPSADEYCDGVDNDCDGDIDEDRPVDIAYWYPDVDGDGYGDGLVILHCDQPTGYVDNDDDCDDSDPIIHPDADELCDGIDNDCQGDIDEDDAVDVQLWYRDADGDGHGDDSGDDRTIDCYLPSGFSDNADDCDDSDAAIHPDADETCDEADNDCDGDIDEDDAVDAAAWYPDADGDTEGSDSSSPTPSCEALPGYVDNDLDCDDSDAEVSTQGTESPYDGIDQDCDGSDLTDVDGDGWDSTEVPQGTDCDDDDPAINPDAIDTWYDGVDSNCDGADDFDQDGDGEPLLGQGGDDCNDSDPAVYPGAVEVDGDGVDSDCDGQDDGPPGDPDSACKGCAGSSATLLLLPFALGAARRRRSQPPQPMDAASTSAARSSSSSDTDSDSRISS